MRLRAFAIAVVAVGIAVGGYFMAMCVARAEGPKEPIWGNAFKGISISAEPVKPQYTLQEELLVTVSIKNVSDDTIQIIRSNPYAQYRMALFDENGVPVAKSKLVIEEENRPPNPAGVEYSRFTSEKLAPGQVTTATFNLSDWFKIEKGGVYQLLVMRQIGDSWEKGFAVSNLTKVEIAKP